VHRADDAFARAHYDPDRAPGQPIQPDDAQAGGMSQVRCAKTTRFSV
jgi:hypothetical protein